MSLYDDRIIEKKISHGCVTVKRCNHLTYERLDKTEKVFVKGIKKVEPKPKCEKKIKLDNYRYLETKEIRRSDRRSGSIVKHQRLSLPRGLETPYKRESRRNSYCSKTYYQQKKPNVTSSINTDIQNIRTSQLSQNNENYYYNSPSNEEFKYNSRTEKIDICKICGKPKRGKECRRSYSVDKTRKSVKKEIVGEEKSNDNYIIRYSGKSNSSEKKDRNSLFGSFDNYQYRESSSFVRPNLRNSFTYHKRRGEGRSGSCEERYSNRFESTYRNEYSEKKGHYCPIHGYVF